MTARIIETGETRYLPEELLHVRSAEEKAKTKVEQAISVIEERLPDDREQHLAAPVLEALKAAGIDSSEPIAKAKKRLNVKSEQKDAAWWWSRRDPF